MTENNLEGKFRTGMLVIAMFLMLVATLHFYLSVQDAIGTWFEYQYESIFRASADELGREVSSERCRSRM